MQNSLYSKTDFNLEEQRESNIKQFELNYSNALSLMGGDKLLKPASSINKVAIRNTSTSGLYKVITYRPDATFRVKYLDESQLLNNKEYSSGTISKVSDDEYEITYFDTEDEIVIEHYDRAGAINFMMKNKLIFQL